MILIDGHFDALHTTESSFGEPTLSGSTLTIPALKLVLLGDHPLAIRGWLACAGELVFTDVASSRRELVPYRGDPRSADGFLPAIQVSDPIPRPRTNQERRSFLFEGFYAGEPLAWIHEWEVQAGACHILVPDDGERPLHEPD